MLLGNVVSIKKPEPDSHFRLRNCPVCNGDNVAYVEYKKGTQEPWRVDCFDCEILLTARLRTGMMHSSCGTSKGGVTGMSYPSPCDTCQKARCVGGRCQAWRTRYLARQKLINGFAKKHGIAPPAGDGMPTEDPCLGCEQREFCDRICPARAKWWDVSIEQLRQKLGADGSDKDI